MNEVGNREADIVHELPADLAEIIGRIVLTYSRLEHHLTGLSFVLLQLNKAEARIALRMPRAVDRLDIALDLLAIKSIGLDHDSTQLRTLIEQATTARDQVAHGLFLKDPDNGDLYLRLARGSWPKNMSGKEPVKRAIYPQAMLFGLKEAKASLGCVQKALRELDVMGEMVDYALATYPERFGTPLPNWNPLGRRKTKVPPVPRESSAKK